MKKNISLLPGLIFVFLLFCTIVNASPLDGLWRNERQDVTIRIEQNAYGFRAKRIDQGIWHMYSLKSEYVYVDRIGNWYEVLNQDEIEWNEATSYKKLVFTKVDSRTHDYWNDHSTTGGTYDHWDRDDSRWNENDWNRNEKSHVEGRWLDKSRGERLDIERVDNGFRVRTTHSAWEKYYMDRSGKRLKSRSGNAIQLLDRNTIRWTSYQGRHERIFMRQGSDYHECKHKINHKGHDCDDRCR